MSEFGVERAAMVRRDLIPRGIDDVRVLGAMGSVPRELFVPPALRHLAYADHPLPIGRGQTISQPYVVALMAQAARIGSTDRVLDVGTGCGYAAAVYSLLAGSVLSLEIDAQLAGEASARLARLGYRVEVRAADAHEPLADMGQFDAIIAAAQASAIPSAWYAASAPGGRIVAPVGDAASQQLLAITRRGATDEWEVADLGEVRFVPLRSTR